MIATTIVILVVAFMAVTARLLRSRADLSDAIDGLARKQLKINELVSSNARAFNEAGVLRRENAALRQQFLDRPKEKKVRKAKKPACRRRSSL